MAAFAPVTVGPRTDFLWSEPVGIINVLLMEGISDAAANLFSGEGFKVERIHELTPEALLEKIETVHIIGVRSKTQLTAAVLERATNLWAVGCFCIGTDQVDLEVAAQKGICVFNSPYANTRSVAELVISEIIALARRWPDLSQAAHAGQWDKRSAGCFEVRGKTLGIVGYGHVGSQLSVLAEALGMQVAFYDVIPKLPLGNSKPMGSMEELLGCSDFLSLHVPKLPSTANLIGEAEVAMMKEGSYLINASRGNVCVVEPVAAALKSGKLQGAAFDVFPQEPASKAEPFTSCLQGCPNTILTPHIGGSTEEAQASIGQDVAGKIINYMRLGTSSGSVNFPEATLQEVPGVHRILNVHFNRPGVLREVNTVLAEYNISAQHLSTRGSIGYVMAQVDAVTSEEAVARLKEMDPSIRTRLIRS